MLLSKHSSSTLALLSLCCCVSCTFFTTQALLLSIQPVRNKRYLPAEVCDKSLGICLKHCGKTKKSIGTLLYYRSTEGLGGIGGASSDQKDDTLTVVVVGGGWAGFSAADSLASIRPVSTEDKRTIKIIMLDAAPRGMGGLAGGYRTSTGRPVDAGIHGFWREYRNTFKAIERIKNMEVDDVLTSYMPSVLVSKSGKVALTSVMEDEIDRISRDNADYSVTAVITRFLATQLPPPIDVAISPKFTSQLTPLDRASGLGLLGAWADFGQDDPSSWKTYDRFSAEDLFRKYAGVTNRLYDDLITPLLHVLPMCPGYDCSAAAALSCFHFFALQSKGAFDVRWCKGSITEKIFNPWAEQLQQISNVEIRGGCKVSAIDYLHEHSFTNRRRIKVIVHNGEEIECDGVVLAVGANAMNNLVSSSPVLQSAPHAKKFGKFRSITCVAVRLFLKVCPLITGLGKGRNEATQLPMALATKMKDSPVIVCGPGIGAIEELQETGFCIYDLQRLQDEFAAPSGVAVLEVDFFRADQIFDKSDDDLTSLTLRAVASALDLDPFDASLIVDRAIFRARDAVSHFSVGSAKLSPPVELGSGIFMCGDWVDRHGHASWSTEKSVVTGIQAAIAFAFDHGLKCSVDVLPTAPESPQLQVLRKFDKTLRSVSPFSYGGIPPSPWTLASFICSR